MQLGTKRGDQHGRSAARVESKRPRMRTLLIAGVVLAVLLGGLIALVLLDLGQQAPRGVREFSYKPAEHTDAPVAYRESPPVGGPHNPLWQNCGFYSEPVRSENAVHSMEHGAVWITYQPNLPTEQVDILRKLGSEQDYVLVSPYPGLPTPVVASAWNNQLRLEGVEDPNLERFVRFFRQGPQTPEPGAGCTGGIGDPES